MIKRIIVEGADQQGKSTLCKLLSEKLGWNIIHFGKPTAEFDFLRGYDTKEKTICDRSFMSEIVYSKVNELVSRTSMTFQCNKAKIADTLLIMMDREKFFVFDSKRHEDYKKEDIEKAIEFYRTVFNKMNMEKMVLNPNSDTYEHEVQSIIDYINDSI